jgi:hypothetical protein
VLLGSADARNNSLKVGSGIKKKLGSSMYKAELVSGTIPAATPAAEMKHKLLSLLNKFHFMTKGSID